MRASRAERAALGSSSSVPSAQPRASETFPLPPASVVSFPSISTKSSPGGDVGQLSRIFSGSSCRRRLRYRSRVLTLPLNQAHQRGQIATAPLLEKTGILWPWRADTANRALWAQELGKRRQELSSLWRSRGWLHPHYELFQNKYFFQDVTWKETVRKLSKCVNNTVSGGEKSVIRNSCSSKLNNSVIL